MAQWAGGPVLYALKSVNQINYLNTPTPHKSFPRNQYKRRAYTVVASISRVQYRRSTVMYAMTSRV